MHTDQVVDFYDLLSLANVLVWLLMAVINIRMLRHPGYWPKWLIISRSIIGVYWAVIYLVLFTANFTPDVQIAFAGNWVRPALLLTGALMGASVIITHRAENHE